ncbi:hypothetical protein [Fibrisoma montanum]|nr:hypothetical protein [Fibrisoma montanum]
MPIDERVSIASVATESIGVLDLTVSVDWFDEQAVLSRYTHKATLIRLATAFVLITAVIAFILLSRPASGFDTERPHVTNNWS